ncbi:PLP-dependent transferase [Sporormia fimetaria CBS 119925]|uniref:PLP-dependent transferase n=1 Tax=Sporormia fimetaria CBS 119925 TaxID=1340428 RepID=A0A6A6VHM4_9PLEO|nr:PLP-dependent transferase [Sporormia fimetaria CBS 119925]
MHTINPEEDKRASYDRLVEWFREREYPMLQGVTYLDHAGTTVPSRTLMNTFNHQMQSILLCNPHSSSSSQPNAAQQIVEHTRSKVLNMFGANPDHFDVVFVANATAGIKLVLEAFTGHKEGFNYYYHRDSHTSLVGARELATWSRCLQSDEEAETWMAQTDPNITAHPDRPTLFAYPAQSNMNGRRLPLSWPTLLRCTHDKHKTFTLLDIAALASTTPINLRNHSTAPDFLVLSFYKIFGFPNLGALIIRKSASHVFEHRKYFGGGTTDMITCTSHPWVARKEALRDRLEDGTGAIHSILALSCAIDTHTHLFGSLENVAGHTTWLSKRLYESLMALRHENGRPLCNIYKDPTSTYGESRTQGATVVFNVVNSDGTIVPSTRVGDLARRKNILVRAGGLCNPAGMAQALGISDQELQNAYKNGFRCHLQNTEVLSGTGNGNTTFGMVRVSLGAVSTTTDVEVFVRFLRDTFLDGNDGWVKEEASVGIEKQEQSPPHELWAGSPDTTVMDTNESVVGEGDSEGKVSSVSLGDMLGRGYEAEGARFADGLERKETADISALPEFGNRRDGRQETRRRWEGWLPLRHFFARGRSVRGVKKEKRVRIKKESF